MTTYVAPPDSFHCGIATASRTSAIARDRCASDNPGFNRTEISADDEDGNRYAKRAFGTRAPRAGSNTSW